MNIDNLMSGYYENDFSDKEFKTFEQREVLPFEMKPAIQEFLNKKFTTIKTGFTCQRLPNGNMNLRTRRYFIIYKK